MNECVICGSYVNPRHWVCKRCGTTYGLLNIGYKEWPDWVKALVNIERKNRRYNQRIDTVRLIEAE